MRKVLPLAPKEVHLGEPHGERDSRPVRQEGQAACWYKDVAQKFRRVVRNLEDHREVCLEEEVERLRRSGMSTSEIAREMGVDEGWVEGLISMSTDDDSG
jgi:hypothetical protein